jgi:hypothetical protein
MPDLLQKVFRADGYPERAVDHWINVLRAAKTPFLVACALSFGVPIVLGTSIYAMALYMHSNLPYRIFDVGMKKAIIMLIPDVSVPPATKQLIDAMPPNQQQLGLAMAFFVFGCSFASVACLIWAAWKGSRVAFPSRK